MLFFDPSIAKSELDNTYMGTNEFLNKFSKNIPYLINVDHQLYTQNDTEMLKLDKSI